MERLRGFEDLDVFRRAYRVSLEVHRTSLGFPAIATGSADEMQVWSLYCRDLGYIDADVAERWQGEYREIARMLQGLSRTASDI